MQFSRIVLAFAALLLAIGPLSGAARAEPAAPAKAESAASADLAFELPAVDSAGRYRTRAQQMISDLVAAGETDLDKLIELVASDSREQLDHLVINLAAQRIYECNFDGQVLSEQKISSGVKGMDTPPGQYSVVNKSPKAYSQKYDAWMLHWMGLTKDGSYGMHGLEGSSYERRLGGVASHGCVRLSRAYAKELYSRVTVGMPVTIVNDAQLDLAKYEPLSRQEALALVLDAIAPADPWETYF